MKEQHSIDLSLVPPTSPGNRLRMLFISHAYVVGVNQGKLDAIAQVEGLEVGLLAPSNWKALEWGRLLPLERPYPNVEIYAAPVLFSGRVGAYFYAPWVLWQIVRDFKPDLIQVETEVFSLCAFEVAILARMTGIPMVVFGWENQLRQLSAARWQICQFVLETAKAIVPGNQDGANLMRSWGYTGLVEVMPQMGVDLDFFCPSPSGHEQKVDRPFNIGFLGRLAAAKGIDSIFAAASQLKTQGLNFQITLCGSGPDEKMLRDEAEKQGIANQVIWRSAVRHEGVPIELASFDVLVLPSRTTPSWKEQFGHVLIEAMAMGIPTIGSSSGEIPHVIGRSDLVFPEDDWQGLAAILERMILDPDWWREVRQYGLDRVDRYYSHQQIATQSIALWKTVLGQTDEKCQI